MIKVKISYKSLIQLFHPCDEEFIKNVCHGYCCHSHSGDGTAHIVINESDVPKLKKYKPELVVKDGILQTGKICIFKDENGLCILHNTPDYPFGCRLSPFTLNKNNTLIIRNRWRLLKCFKATEGKIPAYKVFRESMDVIFGERESQRIIDFIEKNKCDLYSETTEEIYQKIKEKNEALHKAYNMGK